MNSLKNVSEFQNISVWFVPLLLWWLRAHELYWFHKSVLLTHVISAWSDSIPQGFLGCPRLLAFLSLQVPCWTPWSYFGLQKFCQSSEVCLVKSSQIMARVKVTKGACTIVWDIFWKLYHCGIVWSWTPAQSGEAPLHPSWTCSTCWFDLCGEDSYCSRIMSPNTWKLWHNYWRPEKTQESWPSWTVLGCPLQSPDLNHIQH